jgi:ribosomal protein S3
VLQASVLITDLGGPLVVCIPNDRAGLVIGKEGKNILEVQTLLSK